MCKRVPMALALIVFFPLAALATPTGASKLSPGNSQLVRIPGHVLPALANATKVAPNPGESIRPITLTIVLKRDDQAGFEKYLKEIYDPHSKNFHHYLTQREIADRFGPSKADYGSVLAYLRQNGFKLVQGSRNRLTITARGTRRQAEGAFKVSLRDFQVGRRTFFANDDEPEVPTALAPRIEVVSGLSNFASPTHPVTGFPTADEPSGADPNFIYLFNKICTFSSPTPIAAYGLVGAFQAVIGKLYGLSALETGAAVGSAGGLVGAAFGGVCTVLGAPILGGVLACTVAQQQNGGALGGINIWLDPNAQLCMNLAKGGFPPLGTAPSAPRSRAIGVASAQSSPAMDPAPNQQKIGLLEFDGFNSTDVSNWLDLIGPHGPLTTLSVVPVNGGIAAPGPNESEVLLDIDTVMLLASFPDITYTVYEAPSNTSFETLLNAMINDGDTVISNSWSQCEDQTTPSEAAAIDSVLATAAAGGIAVFNGYG